MIAACVCSIPKVSRVTHVMVSRSTGDITTAWADGPKLQSEMQAKFFQQKRTGSLCAVCMTTLCSKGMAFIAHSSETASAQPPPTQMYNLCSKQAHPGLCMWCLNQPTGQEGRHG